MKFDLKMECKKKSTSKKLH